VGSFDAEASQATNKIKKRKKGAKKLERKINLPKKLVRSVRKRPTIFWDAK
jgi:ribosomal protein L13E